MNTLSSLNAASSAKSAHAALAAQKQVEAVTKTGAVNEKARQAAEEFEAVFLNTMISQMFTGIDGDGPFGGGKALGVWRSFLTDEYAKSFAKNGGVGIAPEIYRTLMAQQEVGASAAPAQMEAKP
ncbi:flagellar assembly peptidoglycan hydrolase FlgJ [Pseudorhodoplanes sp.]|uniref:flagellar assembly peptidoglycan hydrolase FlgJ n=1 Tax=Pseudorhodoplanes sp. TaxID=1934341 RepID=UPI0039196CBA